MIAYEIQPRARHECGQALHELQRRHHDMGGPVLVWALELQHDIAGAVEFEPFIGDGGAGDVATQVLEAPLIIRYLRMGVVILYCL